MLIVIEGADGAGKTKQSKQLAERLGYQWMCFPDRSTPIGKLIDGYLKREWRTVSTKPAEATENWMPHSEIKQARHDALVFQGLQLANRTERLQLLNDAVAPHALNLVLDRYWQSGCCYGGLDGLDPVYLRSMHVGLPYPTVSILIDVPVEITMQRLAARGSAPEYYENRERLTKLRGLYLELWQEHCTDPSWLVVDGDGAPEVVGQRLWHAFNGWRDAHQPASRSCRRKHDHTD